MCKDDSCGHVRGKEALLAELFEHAEEDAVDKLEGRMDQDAMVGGLRTFFVQHADRIWEDIVVPAIYQTMRLAQTEGVYPEDDNWEHPDLPELLHNQLTTAHYALTRIARGEHADTCSAALMESVGEPAGDCSAHCPKGIATAVITREPQPRLVEVCALCERQYPPGSLVVDEVDTALLICRDCQRLNCDTRVKVIADPNEPWRTLGRLGTISSIGKSHGSDRCYYVRLDGDDFVILYAPTEIEPVKPVQGKGD